MNHPYLQAPSPVAFAHRGGAREAAENSLSAFRRAVDLGIDYIETDLRATADGVPVVFHDADLQRVSDGFGRIRDLPFSEVRKARIAGADPVASLAEVLREFPDTRFNLDIKEDNAVEPTLEVLAKADALDRVCVASFSWQRLRRVRQHFGEAVCTALAPPEVVALVSRSRIGRLSLASRFVLPRYAHCVQVPHRSAGVPVVTEALVRTAHERGWPVHVWTVDEPAEMTELLDLGVDGLITDRPRVLLELLAERRQGPM